MAKRRIQHLFFLGASVTWVTAPIRLIKSSFGHLDADAFPFFVAGKAVMILSLVDRMTAKAEVRLYDLALSFTSWTIVALLAVSNRLDSLSFWLWSERRTSFLLNPTSVHLLILSLDPRATSILLPLILLLFELLTQLFEFDLILFRFFDSESIGSVRGVSILAIISRHDLLSNK